MVNLLPMDLVDQIVMLKLSLLGAINMMTVISWFII